MRKQFGRIAFITTPRFREKSAKTLNKFLHTHMLEMCQSFEVVTTGRTHAHIIDVLTARLSDDEKAVVGRSLGIPDREPTSEELQHWLNTIKVGLEPPAVAGFKGMIHIAFELIEGRIAAVIHLSDWEDKSAKPDSAALSRDEVDPSVRTTVAGFLVGSATVPSVFYHHQAASSAVAVVGIVGNALGVVQAQRHVHSLFSE